MLSRTAAGVRVRNGTVTSVRYKCVSMRIVETSDPSGALRRPRVLQVTGSASAVRGGVSTTLWSMLNTLKTRGIAPDLVTTDDDGPDRRLHVPLDRFVDVNGHRVRYFARQTRLYAASAPLAAWLSRNVASYDVVHVHGLFSFVPLIAAYHARRHGIPYIMSPHGMLERWCLRNRRARLKRLSVAAVEGPLLRDASRVHFTCSSELEQARDIGFAFEPAVIPLGIESDDSQPSDSPNDPVGVLADVPHGPVVLFLARVDPKKGLDLLLAAFAGVLKQHPSATLVVAGDGPVELTRQLHAQAASLGISRSIRWPGFVSGAAKRAILARSAVFVLPSWSENFGVSVAEAMAAGVPVIVSREVGISSIVAQSAAGIVADRSVEAFQRSICDLLGDPAACRRFGEAGRRVVRTELSPGEFGQRLEGLYRAVADSRSTPRAGAAIDTIT